MSEDFKRIQDPASLFRELHAKFAENLTQSLIACTNAFKEAEHKARLLADFQRALSRSPSPTEVHREMSCIVTEVFADVVTSIYLAAAGLDRPAECVLRRALELGVSLVYLWDMPHIYYAWRDHDEDLSF